MGQLRPAANECNRSPLVPTNRPYFGAGLMCFQLSRCKTIRDKQECKFGTISEWFLLHHITVPFPIYFSQYVDLFRRRGGLFIVYYVDHHFERKFYNS